jgi:hypothetical protein
MEKSLDEKVVLAVAQDGQQQQQQRQRGTERDEVERSTTAREGLVLLPPQLQVHAGHFQLPRAEAPPQFTTCYRQHGKGSWRRAPWSALPP